MKENSMESWSMEDLIALTDVIQPSDLYEALLVRRK